MSGRVVNFGLWYDFRNPGLGNRSFERLYAESLEQITWAEGLGFDSVWLSEHHFCEDGYTPSPLVSAGANLVLGLFQQAVLVGLFMLFLLPGSRSAQLPANPTWEAMHNSIKQYLGTKMVVSACTGLLLSPLPI